MCFSGNIKDIFGMRQKLIFILKSVFADFFFTHSNKAKQT